MQSFSNYNPLFFLSFFIIIFLLIIKIDLTSTNSNCPKEITNNINISRALKSGNFFRYSQCFYCIGYSPKSDAYRRLCILNKTIYEIGNNCNNKYDLSKNLTGNYYELLIINEGSNKTDYLIYFIGYNKHINLFHYSFIFEGNKNEFIKKKEINLEIKNPKSLSCQINSNKNELICFYIIIPYLYAEIFDIKYDFSTINKTNITLTLQNNINEITLKAKIAAIKQKIILIWEQKNNSNTY